MSNEDLVKYWFGASQQDWETVEALMKSKRYMHALFFCHLSLEKYLKGMVVKKDGTAPITHDLLMLAKKANIELTEERGTLLAEVSAFNISARYDDYKNSLYKQATASYTQKYIKEVSDLKRWLQNQ